MNIFKLELKRAIFNKWTLFAFLIALIICLLPIPQKYEYMNNTYGEQIANSTDSVTCITTVFYNWLLFDRSDILLYIFIFIMPLLVALPYGASYYNDLKSGYNKQIISRCHFRTYAIAKYFAAFISGGLVIVLPLVIQFMILMLIFPLDKPLRFFSLMIGETTFSIDLFYEHPILHTLLWCAIVFIVAGLLATLSLAVSRMVYNYFGIILTPFVISFILVFLTYVTGRSELSFIYTLSTNCLYDMNYGILFAEIIVMFIVSFIPFVFQKKEVL